ncbi:MAG: hypothetical protein IT204_04295 [Fimbriimonadaceae bacterium]|nr:hypothetical protein [Fimbriimonadaceae bacterium]
MGDQPQVVTGLFQTWFSEHLFCPLTGVWFWLAVLASILAFCGVLAVLQKLNSAARRRLTVVCTFLAGLFYSLDFFCPERWDPVQGYVQPLGNFLLVLSGFSIGLGIINLVMVHGRRLARGGGGAINSVAFFLGFLGMLVFGLLAQPVEDGATRVSFATGVFEVLFRGLLNSLDATTFALLGFFIVTAAYRAFRIRTVEAGLMTVVAFLVMLGQVPAGQALTAWIPEDHALALLRIENIQNWLLTVPNTAAARGILFGSAVGGFALSLRVWLSLEQGSYFREM